MFMGFLAAYPCKIAIRKNNNGIFKRLYNFVTAPKSQPKFATKMKKAFLIATLIGLTTIIHAQFLSKIGINVGAGLASQNWKYHLNGTAYDFNQTAMIGKSAVISCEKRLNHVLSIRPELGYMQTGFKSTMKLYYNGNDIPDVQNKDVVFNNLVLNVGLKIVPTDKNLNPYLVLGVQTAYLLSFKDVAYQDIKMWTAELEKFNKLTVGGVLAAGFEYKNRVYLECVYIPALISRYNKDGDTVKDMYLGVNVGVNLKYHHTKKIHTLHSWYNY